MRNFNCSGQPRMNANAREWNVWNCPVTGRGWFRFASIGAHWRLPTLKVTRNFFTIELSTQDRDQMAEFAIDIFGPGDSVGDLCAQQFAETLPEPMHRHFHGALRQIQLLAYLHVRS